MTELLLAPILFLFCLAVVYGALSDVANYTIPNWVSYGLVALFAVNAALHWQPAALAWHVAIALLVFAICFIFWRFAWLGGGDVKFVSAIALWMGPAYILPYLVALCLASLVLVGLLKLAARRSAAIQAGAWPAVVKRMLQKAEDNALPYGLPAAVAAIAVILPASLARL
jgi:prepilin peptidase CpaA